MSILGLLFEKARLQCQVRKAHLTERNRLLVYTLRKNGVVVIPEFFSSEQIEAIRSGVPNLEKFTESPEGDGALFFPDAHRSAALAPFFENSLIAEVVRGYLSKSAIPLRCTVGVKVVSGPILCFESFFHMDTWKPRLKAYLFVEDVTKENGPLVYLTRSHRGLWRLASEDNIRLRYRTDNLGFASSADVFYVGCFWPHEVSALKEKYGFDEFVCTGPAGTLVVFDARGLHRASALADGATRVILMSYWVHPGEHT